MPRSLLSCYDQIARHLELLAKAYGGKRGECHRLAGELHARLRYGRIQDIFQAGLHEFLTEFIERAMTLGSEITDALSLLIGVSHAPATSRTPDDLPLRRRRSPRRSRRCG